MVVDLVHLVLDFLSFLVDSEIGVEECRFGVLFDFVLLTRPKVGIIPLGVAMSMECFDSTDYKGSLNVDGLMVKIMTLGFVMLMAYFRPMDWD